MLQFEVNKAFAIQNAVIASGLLPAGIADYVRRGPTEFFWKRDIRLGYKALRLKVKHTGQVHYVQLGKMHVVKASTKTKPLRTFKPIRRHTVYIKDESWGKGKSAPWKIL
jgi:hypothetical protein